MDMGHLYHDSYFTSLAIELAVKERLKTREVNAREDRALALVSQEYNRAKLFCKRTQAHERWRVGQSLRRIRERTPALDYSLAAEKARVESLQKALLSRKYGTGAGIYELTDSTPKDRHHIKTDLSNVATSTAETHDGVTIPSDRTTSEGGNSGLLNLTPDDEVTPIQWGQKKYRWSRRADKPLNTDTTHVLLRQSGCVTRSQHTVKALARLSWRQDKRRLDHQLCKEALITFSRPILDRARVILKGRDDLDVEKFLEDFQRFVIGPDLPTFSGKPEHLDVGPHDCLGERAKAEDVTDADCCRPADDNSVGSGQRGDENVRPEILNHVTLPTLISFGSPHQLDPAIRDMGSADAFRAGLVEQASGQSQRSNIKSDIPSTDAATSNTTLEAEGVNADGNITNVTGNCGHVVRKTGPLTSPQVGAVWLPRLWRQHKRRLFNTDSLPAMKRKHRKL